MSIVTPNVSEARVLAIVLNQTVTVRLFSNNLTPIETTVSASFTQVAGGGYAAGSAALADWTITEGAPSSALLTTPIIFNFTSATNAPGTIYGYYVLDATNVVLFAERFDAAVVPFTPVAGSQISIQPRWDAS